MDIESIIKEKLGFKYFFTFSEYTDTWACIHADALKYYYNDKANMKDLRIVYGNTLSECVLKMCKLQNIDITTSKKELREGGGGDLWFEYGTD